MGRLKGNYKRVCYIKDHVCHIPLNNGQEALCDEDRFDEIKNYNWCVPVAGYAYTRLGSGINNKGKNLHRLLYPELKQIDHINNNKLDNRSCNLRECNCVQNQGNRFLSKNNTSGYKGVSFCKANNKWRARIHIDYRGKHIGYYSTPEEAALAYNKAAIKYFGEFAKLNDLDSSI